MRIPWITGDPKLPVWMGAYRPKALELTGRQADGFILQLADPFLTESMVEAVHFAAERVGRDQQSLTTCVAAPACVTDGSEEQLAHAREPIRTVRRSAGQATGLPLPQGVGRLLARRGGLRTRAGIGVRIASGMPDRPFGPRKLG